VRLFIAINLPDDKRLGLAQALDALAGHDLPVRWLSPESLHITLKFLGEVAQSRVPSIESALTHALAGYPSFDVEVGGFGAFPSLTRPSIFWVGVSATDELVRVQTRVDDAMTKDGFEPDARAYRPHITVGRARKDGRVRDRATMDRIVTEFDYKTVFRAGSVDLMRSRLGSRGARYEVLHKMEMH
jgi:2'-5' RNA ligase